MGAPGEITRLLDQLGRGNKGAADLLLPLLYEELRRLARARMAKVPAGNTLQPTALVHEAYLRLIGSGASTWKSRGHFFGAASKAMWQILVEQARAKSAVKRGGDQRRVDLADIEMAWPGSEDTDPERILALERALAELGVNSREAQVVLLRYVVGLSTVETAAALDVGVRTVERDWRFARAFLHVRMHDPLDEPSAPAPERER